MAVLFVQCEVLLENGSFPYHRRITNDQSNNYARDTYFFICMHMKLVHMMSSHVILHAYMSIRACREWTERKNQTRRNVTRRVDVTEGHR
jgi:hypothetical protein